MIAVSMKGFVEQAPKISARIETAETDMDLRIAIYQGKPAVELLPLRNKMMFSAAAAGDIELMKAQLAQGANLRARDIRPGTRNETLLHVAAREPDTAPVATFLTPREVDLLNLFAKGASYKEAARELDISPLTVGNHVKSIYRKLAVNSRGEAVYSAVRSGQLKI